MLRELLQISITRCRVGCDVVQLMEMDHHVQAPIASLLVLDSRAMPGKQDSLPTSSLPLASFVFCLLFLNSFTALLNLAFTFPLKCLKISILKGVRCLANFGMKC